MGLSIKAIDHVSPTGIFITMRCLPIYFILVSANAYSAPEPVFSELVINAGFNVEQPLLVAALGENDDRHIVLAGSTDEHEQRLAVYRLRPGDDSPTQPILELAPGPNLIAYDVGRIGDIDALFFIEPGRIFRYDLSSNEFVEVVKIRTIYGQQRSGDIVPIDFIRDVNEDGLDDLVVPDTAGYRVRLQRSDGSLGEESVLLESSNMTVDSGLVSFESRPLFSGDMNFDGLVDLAVWRGDSLRIYPRRTNAGFQSEPQVLPLDLDLLSEAEIRALEGRFGSVDLDGLRVNRIWSIEDLNSDQIPDILTESTLNQGVFDKRNDLRLYLGRRVGDQLVYLPDEDALLASEGLQYGLITTDIDGDGKKDLLTRTVRLTFGRVIRALLSGNVSLQLQFYRLTNGAYQEPANYVTKTNVHFSMTSGHVDIPAVKVADFDDDGQQDLMMQTRADRLSFYRGVPAENLFAKEASDFDVALPRNGDLVTTNDINGDGRADLIIRYNAADGSSLARTVRLLLTQNW